MLAKNCRPIRKEEMLNAQCVLATLSLTKPFPKLSLVSSFLEKVKEEPRLLREDVYSRFKF